MTKHAGYTPEHTPSDTPEHNPSASTEPTSYVVLVNPRGVMVEFNVGDPNIEKWLYSQRPLGVKPDAWFREATDAELASYKATRGVKPPGSAVADQPISPPAPSPTPPPEQIGARQPETKPEPKPEPHPTPKPYPSQR